MSQAVYVTDLQSETVVPFAPEELGMDVVEGDPEIFIHVLRDSSGGDGNVFSGVASIQPSTFHYKFVGDEIINVLEGEVRIVVDDETTVNLRTGSIASFTKGSQSVWSIQATLREFFVLTNM